MNKFEKDTWIYKEIMIHLEEKAESVIKHEEESEALYNFGVKLITISKDNDLIYTKTKEVFEKAHDVHEKLLKKALIPTNHQKLLDAEIDFQLAKLEYAYNPGDKSKRLEYMNAFIDQYLRIDHHHDQGFKDAHKKEIELLVSDLGEELINKSLQLYVSPFLHR